MKLEKIQPGMLLHSWGRSRSVLRERCSWPVRIVEVDLVGRRVFASWNSNKAQWWPERHAVKWRKESFWDAERRKAESEGK